jgi:putative endonuclease
MTTARRVRAEAQGRQAEGRALAHLEAQGWSCLARRVKTKAGEIDLIVARAEVTAFVEVKARARLDAAAASLTRGQARRIVAAAMIWLGGAGQARAHGDCRFDIVLVSPYDEPLHIENAFGEELW